MATIEIKLMIDPKSNKVIFAEASKDFVDFLIFLLSLPIGTATKLLTTVSMVGSIGNVYTSVTNLNETYLQPNINKNVLLNPFVFSCVKDIPLSINASSIISSGKLYTCGRSNCKKGITNVSNGASCPKCNGQMSKEIEFYGSDIFVTPQVGVADKSLEGYVKREASYMISDDLSVRLISTMAIFSMMKKFNVSELEERIVKIGNDEALELLKASLQSTTVLTDVFLKRAMDREDVQGGDFAASEKTSEDVDCHELVLDDIAEVEEVVKDEAEKVEENDESKVEQNEEMNSGEKEPEANKPLDSVVLEKHPEPEGKGSKKENIKKEETSMKKEEEPKTPNPTIVDCPVHERRSVERLVPVIDTGFTKEVRIEKGRGTALKDIPNVAFKLSRRKCDDDTCKLLHTILFGSQGKAALIKSNISRFSGFAWRNNEDEQKNKIKEKLYKCNKGKLVDLCEILDIQISKAKFAKTEEVIVKLMEFFEAPHVTTSELLSDTSSIPNSSPPKAAKRPRDSDITSSAPNDSKKKKSEPVKEKDSAPMKPASKDITGTKNEKAKNKSEEVEAFTPSDDQLRVAICDILKQVDFNTTTFTYILKQLAKQFESDLTARKYPIKVMIEAELTRMA